MTSGGGYIPRGFTETQAIMYLAKVIREAIIAHLETELKNHYDMDGSCRTFLNEFKKKTEFTEQK